MCNKSNRGMFIALEGIDGSGKSTQIKLLKDFFVKEGLPLYITKEPTDSEIGKLIRKVLSGSIEMDRRALAELFVADRIDHITNKKDGLLSKLNDGINVITDRYYFSYYAYQSIGSNLDLLITHDYRNAELLKPDVTIYLELPVGDAMKRIECGRSIREIYEKEEFLLAVKKSYDDAFRKLIPEGEHVEVVHADVEEKVVAKRIWDIISTLLKKRSGRYE